MKRQDMGSQDGGFVLIDPGTFMMGSPEDERLREDWETLHEVTITRPFHMGRTPVTRGQWREVMGNDPSNFSDDGDDCPVEQVSWYDGVAYLNALSESQGLEPCYELRGCTGKAGSGATTGKAVFACEEVVFLGLECTGYRLPTEAEWEYAARAGSAEPRYGKLGDIAWYSRNAKSRTHPVAQKKPNAWGLYDVLGNVGEWVQDGWGLYDQQNRTDPVLPGVHRSKMIRGFGWVDSHKQLRFAYRNGAAPSFRVYHIGVRAARTVAAP